MAAGKKEREEEDLVERTSCTSWIPSADAELRGNDVELLLLLLLTTRDELCQR